MDEILSLRSRDASLENPFHTLYHSIFCMKKESSRQTRILLLY